jgi:hypothetical protein
MRGGRICLDRRCYYPWTPVQPEEIQETMGWTPERGGARKTKLCDPDAPIPEPTGILQPIASRILMKILRAACMCRYDLLRAVCGLASCATKRTRQYDSDLPRLICYINTTKHHSMIGWCGGLDTILDLRVYADADFAGCVHTVRSTTGVALVMEGPNTRMVVNGVSKRQTAVSHSTPKAEIVAADYAMRAEGMPAYHYIGTASQTARGQ